MKVAICIPNDGTVTPGFTLSLSRMLVRSVEAGIEPETFFDGTLDEMKGAAREWGALWLLILEPDSTFPPDTLVSLLTLGKAAAERNGVRLIDTKTVETGWRFPG